MVLLAAGAGFLAAAGAGNGSPPLLIVGILGTTFGGLLLAPLAITGLSALCGRTRLTVRLPVRDLARYRAGSGAALAAIFRAIEIAAIGFTARYADPVSLTGPNLTANELIFYDAPPDNSGAPD